jgi:hypothetical protein
MKIPMLPFISGSIHLLGLLQLLQFKEKRGGMMDGRL